MSQNVSPIPLPPVKPNQYRELFTNPAARTYLMVAAGGLLVALLTMFLIGSLIATVLLLMVGLCGLVLRWSAMPIFFVVLVCYFSYAPLGVPFVFGSISNIPTSNFRFLDVVLVGGSLVYLIGQYRLFSIVQSGMPFDANKLFVKTRAKPTVRPAEAPRDRELWMLFARVGIFVLGGQLLWYAITNWRVDFERVPPVVFMAPIEGFRRSDTLFVPDYLSRFLLAFGFFLAVAIVSRFVFWYWRLLQLQRDQAQMILIDTQWSEDRREMNRQEKWRGWQKGKILGTNRTKIGCGGWFLALGLPLILLVLFILVLNLSSG